jgi:hypothetical protein
MDRRVWLSPRALRLHAVILIIVPGFLALCVWQLERALGGNDLSWAYVFEWPFFAGYAVYMWWRIVHEVPDVPSADATTAPATSTTTQATNGATNGTSAPEDATEAAEDAELAAYNEYLAELAARDEATGR